MKNATVSVIINTFARPKMLKEAVASVQCQTLENWELILAVDHQEDYWHTHHAYAPGLEVQEECCAVAEELGASDCRIKLVCTDLKPGDQSLNRFARNINLSFPHTTGRFVSYLCDDDLYTPWRLSVFSRVLDENPDYSVVYGKQIVWDIKTDRGIEERLADFLLPVHPEGIHPGGRVNHNSIMHRRECFNAVGGWVEDAPARLGDAYFFARLNQKYAFHPIDCVGEVMRMGEQCCWSGKPQSEAEKVNVGAFA